MSNLKLDYIKINSNSLKNKDKLMLITFKNLKDNMKIKLPHLFKDKLKKIKKYKKCSEIKWK